MSTSTEPDTAKQQQLPLPFTIKGILFDMDGTLTDSDTLHFEAYRETFLKVFCCCTECSCCCVDDFERCQQRLVMNHFFVRTYLNWSRKYKK